MVVPGNAHKLAVDDYNMWELVNYYGEYLQFNILLFFIDVMENYLLRLPNLLQLLILRLYIRILYPYRPYLQNGQSKGAN